MVLNRADLVNLSQEGLNLFEVIVIVLLLAVVGLLFRINNKLPERDWVKEAMERDASK